MANTKTLDPKKYSVAFAHAVAGARTITGYHSGTVIEIEPVEDAVAAVVGAGGEVTRAMTGNYSHLLRITLGQGAKDNDYFSQIAALDRASGLGIASVLVRDALGTSVVATPDAWIKRMPTETRTQGQPEGRVWEWFLAQPDINWGGQ